MRPDRSESGCRSLARGRALSPGPSDEVSAPRDRCCRSSNRPEARRSGHFTLETVPRPENLTARVRQGPPCRYSGIRSLRNAWDPRAELEPKEILSEIGCALNMQWAGRTDQRFVMGRGGQMRPAGAATYLPDSVSVCAGWSRAAEAREIWYRPEPSTCIAGGIRVRSKNS